MNYISCPLLNIVVSEKSTRATYIAFMNELVKRIPFVCDRIFSYMEQEYLPNNKMAVQQIVTKTQARLFEHASDLEGKSKDRRSAVLINGWHLATCACPTAFATNYLARVEEAIKLPIIAVLESHGNQNNYSGGAHRNIGQVEYDLLVLTLSNK